MIRRPIAAIAAIIDQRSGRLAAAGNSARSRAVRKRPEACRCMRSELQRL